MPMMRAGRPGLRLFPVVTAIRKVLSGSIYVSDKWRDKLMHKFVGGSAAVTGTSPGMLSDRELEVLQLIAQGYSTQKIAEELYVSGKTIESHYANIKNKLDLKNSHAIIQVCGDVAPLRKAIGESPSPKSGLPRLFSPFFFNNVFLMFSIIILFFVIGMMAVSFNFPAIVLSLMTISAALMAAFLIWLLTSIILSRPKAVATDSRAVTSTHFAEKLPRWGFGGDSGFSPEIAVKRPALPARTAIGRKITVIESLFPKFKEK